MATISMYVDGEGHGSYFQSSKVPYLVETVIDWADAADEKGSALAAADVIQAIEVPAGSLVLQAGLQVIDVATGESADVALDLGYGGDVDLWVDGFDLDAAAAGAYATLVGDAAAGAGAGPVLLLSSADTIDVLIQAATTAPTGGSIRVFALIVDLSAFKKPGIVAIGS